jgi:hypothetical protein
VRGTDGAGSALPERHGAQAVPDLSRNDREDDHGEESEVEDEEGEEGEENEKDEKIRCGAQNEALGGKEGRPEAERREKVGREEDQGEGSQSGCQA